MSPGNARRKLGTQEQTAKLAKDVLRGCERKGTRMNDLTFRHWLFLLCVVSLSGVRSLILYAVMIVASGTGIAIALLDKDPPVR